MGEGDPTVDEIRSVFRLVNACCERWDDPEAWQAELLSGVSVLLECRATQVQIARPGPDRDRPEIVPLASRGWLEPGHERLYRESLDGTERPALPNADKVIGPAAGEGSAAAFSRPMVVSDDVWYACEFYTRYVEPMGMDEWAMSFRPAPQFGAAVMIGGSREAGAPSYEPRHLQLLGILAEEIVPLLGTRLSLAGQASKAGLTPRQRQTLELLLDGMSEKQVAHELGLSKATVHDYVVKLHRHFDVSSRGELLSYFIKRRPKDAPGT